MDSITFAERSIGVRIVAADKFVMENTETRPTMRTTSALRLIIIFVTWNCRRGSPNSNLVIRGEKVSRLFFREPQV